MVRNMSRTNKSDITYIGRFYTFFGMSSGKESKARRFAYVSMFAEMPIPQPLAGRGTSDVPGLTGLRSGELSSRLSAL